MNPEIIQIDCIKWPYRWPFKTVAVNDRFYYINYVNISMNGIIQKPGSQRNSVGAVMC